MARSAWRSRTDSFSVSDFNWPQAARMSRPRGVRTGEDELAFASASLVPTPTAAIDPNNPATWGKVGRNDDCPCGSGKKYKHCHGRYA